MITLFNRKELLATFSVKQQAEVRDRLAAAGIDYRVKTVNRNSPSPLSDTRARTGTLGQNMDLVYEYIIYVKRGDYEKALQFIG